MEYNLCYANSTTPFLLCFAISAGQSLLCQPQDHSFSKYESIYFGTDKQLFDFCHTAVVTSTWPIKEKSLATRPDVDAQDPQLTLNNGSFTQRLAKLAATHKH